MLVNMIEISTKLNRHLLKLQLLVVQRYSINDSWLVCPRQKTIYSKSGLGIIFDSPDPFPFYKVSVNFVVSRGHTNHGSCCMTHGSPKYTWFVFCIISPFSSSIVVIRSTTSYCWSAFFVFESFHRTCSTLDGRNITSENVPESSVNRARWAISAFPSWRENKWYGICATLRKFSSIAISFS